MDGVRSVVNNVTVAGGASNQADAQDPADRNQAQEDDHQPVQQAQSTDPNQQQAPYKPQDQPQPGAGGNWGKAGPPPDAQNGQIPQQPASGRPVPDAGSRPGSRSESGNGAPPPPQQSRPAYNGQYPQQQGYAQQPYGGRTVPMPRPASRPLPSPSSPEPLFSIRTSEPLDSHRLRGGETFQATLAQDMYQGQYLAVPRGAVVQGRVIGVKKPGDIRGSAGFALQITSLTLGGQTYPVSTDTFATDTRGKGGYTAANTVGGAAIGALIGAVAGGGPGAAIGAVAGGGLGLGASVASAGPRSIMPPETLLTFHLKAPLTVSPISLAEVQQLQASVAPPRRPVRPVRPIRHIRHIRMATTPTTAAARLLLSLPLLALKNVAAKRGPAHCGWSSFHLANTADR